MVVAVIVCASHPLGTVYVTVALPFLTLAFIDLPFTLMVIVSVKPVLVLASVSLTVNVTFSPALILVLFGVIVIFAVPLVTVICLVCDIVMLL